MHTYNKIYLAGEMLVESVRVYRAARRRVEFISAILLAGAVIGIIAPCVEELGGQASDHDFVDLLVAMKKLRGATPQDLKKYTAKVIRERRYVYNSLKHAGKKKRGESPEIKPSDDCELIADLQLEAYSVIGRAIDDYIKYINIKDRGGCLRLVNNLPEQLLDILQMPWVEEYPHQF
ncbi:hypothetical protein [Rivihabitans pingtungensis]|uniref:hypothetical protein n=1 Tax=Rivihabitans pingtungensis TaxID=1054498 RepID=UPI002357FF84|nr:hypothetical protein [Rivihabitans pingtungensis]MCK6436265.1 hypothetical protein [Rivihabitans pingtungensis]